MNATNRIAHYFPAVRSVVFRDLCAHVDGYVLIEQNDGDLRETSARVEVFDVELADSARQEHEGERSNFSDERFGGRFAANMIPIRCGQRFRVWSRNDMPVKLCFLPADRPHEVISVELFASR